VLTFRLEFVTTSRSDRTGSSRGASCCLLHSKLKASLLSLNTFRYDVPISTQFSFPLPFLFVALTSKCLVFSICWRFVHSTSILPRFGVDWTAN